MTLVTVESVADGIRRIGLNRADKRNALNPSLRGALIEAFEAASGDEAVHAIVIAGNGGHFCAGGDIDSMEGLTPQTGRARMKLNHRMVHVLAETEKPVIAAVSGFAVGAGAGIALLADTVVMGEGATIGFPFFRIGLVPDYGILFSLPRRVGAARARQILLYARMLKGQDAHDAGLADELVDDEQVEARAVQRAQELAAMPPHAFAIAKRQLGLWPTSLEGALEMEAMAQAACFSTSEFAEGRAAFCEKRAPNFRG
jgi:2-(1,2-epoxy-1,2-dihydrophenyl)acetyl-CoA isomerase